MGLLRGLILLPIAALALEPMSWKDNPTTFSSQPMDFCIDNLPKSGATNVQLWSSSYFPTFMDGPNANWGGGASAVARYGAAFGSAPGIEARVSRMLGVDSVRGFSCTSAMHCGQGRVCAKRAGRAFGKCIDTWAGLCHSWAAASIAEPAPRCPVNVNGVNFRVGDVKALVVAAYSRGVTIKLLSSRCYDRPVRFDISNRPTNPACRDTNPAALHLALTNIMGKQGKTFIMNEKMSYEVWNYPLVSYSILQETPIDRSAAIRLVGPGQRSYVWNPSAQQFRYVRMQVRYLGVARLRQLNSADNPANNANFHHAVNYEYVLELDGGCRILGGEWVGASKRNHPDFLWYPIGKGANNIADISYANVKRLLAASANCAPF